MFHSHILSSMDGYPEKSHYRKMHCCITLSDILNRSNIEWCLRSCLTHKAIVVCAAFETTVTHILRTEERYKILCVPCLCIKECCLLIWYTNKGIFLTMFIHILLFCNMFHHLRDHHQRILWCKYNCKYLLYPCYKTPWWWSHRGWLKCVGCWIIICDWTYL
jgi:hypothetical protein